MQLGAIAVFSSVAGEMLSLALLALVAVLALALATAPRALAHAELVEARPAAGSTLPL